MLPPTDSLQHQNLKLAELISSAQNFGAAPPAYFAARSEEPAPCGDEDQLVDEYDYPQSRSGPITINIDASLKIEGHANTIVLPAAPSPASSPACRPASAMDPPQPSYQNGRVEKLTSMVLTALKDAELLDDPRERNCHPGRRPIGIHVNAGVVLKGSKNTVCSGLPKLIKAASVGATRGKPDAKREEGGVASESGKRRACSEPPEVSTPKKTRWC